MASVNYLFICFGTNEAAAENPILNAHCPNNFWTIEQKLVTVGILLQPKIQIEAEKYLYFDNHYQAYNDRIW